ncbi:immunoglobulin-like and fibronectin type III domain-containing protein 1 isoform X2 [Anguilla anguilla]|uniref:immunoglobulin-like and fibronectin type III domain-containing protein 1 isoform X2 n=1 Tax=Anguilla anguilla TaxID=7936 RepID=UPI0015B3162E|nr:immunoglobulin-like and fibronectin type III domain-containing protein 1 isoform X2 [Anguilla anguilla]
MWRSKVSDQTAAGQVAVKKQSKVPGVMITQFVEELPAGKSTPDFLRKPIALTIQEGKSAQFKAVVSGDPKPEVVWKRAKGEINDDTKFHTKYDEGAEEYILEITSVTGKEGDIYKCFAVNEFGKAVCTAALNVIEVGFNKEKAMEGPGLSADPAEFRKMLRKSSGRVEKVEKEKKDDEIPDKFWEILLSSERKDYERICAEYGVKDFRWMLKKLNILKKEREEEQSLYLNVISNLRHIEVKGDSCASFELVLDLKDPRSRIFLYKDGIMIPLSEDMEMKHHLKKIGKKLVFTIKDLLPEDAGLYQVDVEEVNVFSTDFKIPMVDFIVKIKEVKAKEREDAIFECVLSHPFPKILWKGKNSLLEAGEKFEITVSADKLIHRLRVKDCKQVDKGIYSAVAGIKSCSAWLTVEADTGPHKKKVRKTTQAGGAGVDLDKMAQEQQAKLQKEKDDKLEAMRKEAEGKDTGNMMNGLDNGSGVNSGLGDGLDGLDGLDGGLGRKKGDGMDSGSGGIGDGGLGGDKSGDIKGQRNIDAATADSDLENDKESRQVSHKENEQGKGQGNKQENVQGKGQGNKQENVQGNRRENGQQSSGSGDWPAEHARQGPLLLDEVIDSGVQFISGLSDINAKAGQPVELVCKLNNENCNGAWFKDGNTLSPGDGLSLSKDGAAHKLKIDSCRPDDTGKYCFEADGRKTEAMITVEDPGVQFISGLSDINAKAGQPAELVCKLNNENSNGEWFKDGKKLSPRDGLSLSKDGAAHKLKIDSCRADDTGKYCFEAEGRKTEAKITVEDPRDQFIIGLSDIRAKTGQPAELVCKLKENCNGAWFKDGKKLSPRDGLSLSKDGASHKLKIKSCRADDTGKYSFEAGGHKTEAVITVEDPEDPFIIGLSDIRAKAGQPAQLVCKLKENCDGEWFKDGKKLSPRDGLSLSKDGASHKLKIDSCQADDTGKYCFEAEGCKTEAKITVEDPGVQFVNGLSDINAKAGQPAELVCKLNKENCNGAWFKDGKRLLPRDGLSLSKDGACQKLKIDSCCADDTGNYRFEAERCKTEAMIIVEDAGVQFIRGLSDLNAKTGQPAELVCKLNNENCNGTWFKDGNKLSPRDGLSLSKDGASHKLKIDSCQANDTGKYCFETEGRKTEAMITVEGPGVEVISGLSDIKAKAGQPAELVCKLSDENSNGVWFKDGKKLSQRDGLSLSKDGASHKLKIDSCQADDTGKYRFEADGRKTEAILIVEDPPRFSQDALDTFSKPVIVKVGQNATFKMPFVGGEPTKVQWYKEGEELLDNANVKLEIMSAHSRLLLSSCQRKDTGEIKIKVKNDFGTIEAVSKLVVLDKPSPPLGPVEVVENSASCINMKWRPPKDDGGSQLQEYALERQQVGRNTWTKLGQIPSATAAYKDTNVEHGRKYCYRIRAVNEEGVSEPMETEDIMAGIKAYPGPPASPKVVSAFNDCINLTWAAPAKTGGSPILGYYLEKRKRGSNMWSPVNPEDEPIQDKKYTVKDVIVGMAYEFRVSAINVSGVGEPSIPSDFVIARDPKQPPGRVTDLKVTDSTYTTLTLAWTKPTEEKGVQDEAKGYFVEIRPAESQDWIRCNAIPIIMTTFTVKNLKSMAIYWVRVTATNDGGDGVPQDLDNYVTAMPPPVRPRFTDTKLKSFMVVRAGNTVRINVNFQASPWPDVVWLKDNMSVPKRVTISNTEGMSQLLIPSSERSDTGVYTIILKNMVGQETFSVEIRVTDDPKPPGPVELQENVPGTVTVAWEPSPDEKRDDRLHYMVSKRDSTKQTWNTVADRLFNNKFTACNIVPGHEYHFRVYAKNDIGMSEPSESPTWGTTRIREKFVVNTPEFRPCNLESAPAFLVPLKLHMAPKGYECYMSCAVTGNPRPHVTWYHNNLSLNTNTNYYISNTCGVCSMLILRVGPNDHGEYSVMAENSLGRAECSTKLTVRE